MYISVGPHFVPGLIANYCTTFRLQDYENTVHIIMHVNILQPCTDLWVQILYKFTVLEDVTTLWNYEVHVMYLTTS